MLIKSPDYISQDDFLNILETLDKAIGNGSSMGEKKSFVLAQLLQLKYPGEVVVFSMMIQRQGGISHMSVAQSDA